MADAPITIVLSSAELRLLEAAVHAYLDDFGHEEAELLRELKALAAKLAASTAGAGAGAAIEQSSVSEL